MVRFILIYGAIAGAVIVALMQLNIRFIPGETGAGSVAAGYLFMLMALSTIFVAVKKYRDQELGGVIRFWSAFRLGLGIAVLTGIIYALGWEIYYAFGGSEWIQAYTEGLIDSQRAGGLSGEELEAFIAETEKMAAMYENPLVRIPLTWSEILPVGIAIDLVAAGLFRNPKFLPAHG